MKIGKGPFKQINAASDIELVPDHIFNTTIFCRLPAIRGINTLLIAWEAVRANPLGIFGTQ